ncbi:MAG: hypothetical protein NC452_04995 [Eubacterium sp.]|nr:hypothetical protein [Eubacterium sp.]
MYNDASKKATIKYIKENLDEVRFRVRKGLKDEYKNKAKAAGMSLAEFIKAAIDEYVENHGL